MTDGERLVLAVFIILAITALLAAFILAAQVADMRTRLDVLDDAGTPSFEEDHAPTEKAAELEPEPEVPTLTEAPQPARRPSPVPRTDTTPKAEAIEQWRVDLDRQYREAMAALNPDEDE